MYFVNPLSTATRSELLQILYNFNYTPLSVTDGRCHKVTVT